MAQPQAYGPVNLRGNQSGLLTLLGGRLQLTSGRCWLHTMRFGGFRFQKSKEGIRSAQTSNGADWLSTEVPPMASRKCQQKLQQVF